MIKVIFKNLDKSELAKQAITERLTSVIEKFPDLEKSNINVTLEMQNSPYQAGPDLFSVKAQFSGGRYKGIRVQKSAQSFYVALADLAEHMLELLNRFGDRARIKARSSARKLIQQSKISPGEL